MDYFKAKYFGSKYFGAGLFSGISSAAGVVLDYITHFRRRRR